MGECDGFNLSDAEFDAVMTEIDAELRRETDSIVGRHWLGLAKFFLRFQIRDNPFTPLTESLTIRILRWLRALYGERLNFDMDFGRSFVVIRGDVYRIRCVGFYGVMYAICSIEAIGRKIRERTQRLLEHTITNLFDGGIIEGLTPDLAGRLSFAERGEVLRRYGRVFLALSRMRGALSALPGDSSEAPYIKEAMDDLLESSETLLLQRPNYGQSNWASLQATEKVLKSYIRQKGGNHCKNHDLKELCGCAEGLGLPAVDQALIRAIQCSPEVRYDSALVSKEKALAAYEAALTACATTAAFIRRSYLQATVSDVQMRINDGAPINALMLVHDPPILASLVERGIRCPDSLSSEGVLRLLSLDAPPKI